MRRPAHHRLLLLVPLLLATVVAASEPKFWTVANQSGFLKGDVDNVVVDSDGRVTLGPDSTVLAETKAPFIWNLHVGGNGSLVAGTGNEGNVLEVTKDGKQAVLFDSQELQVHAVASARDGTLFVGTSPDGQVYRIKDEKDKAPFYDPPDKYIWALAVAADGTVYAATGDKGRIYRITPKGEGSLFYDTKTTHVTSLAVDEQGRVLAATASPGRVYRIDTSRKAFVLLESPFKQVQAIRLGRDGVVYATAMDPSGKSTSTSEPEPKAETSATEQQVPAVTTDIVVTGVGEVPVGQRTEQEKPEPTAPPAAARGAVYRIGSDDVWSTVWESESDLPYDLYEEASGTLLVATGNEGKIYRLAGDPVRTALVARASAEQVTRIASTRDAVYFATANPGKILRMATARATEGTFTSEVRDAETVARWGTIRWRAQTPERTRVELATRTGNTSTADATWSEWSSPYTNATGSTIESPPARYIQWRARLTGSASASPVLTSVTTTYLPRNQRPEITSLTVHPPGVVFQRPFAVNDTELAGLPREPAGQRAAAASIAETDGGTSVLGRKLYHKGLQTFAWEGRDNDDDPLLYELYFRRADERSWTPIERHKTDTFFTWDTSSVADGTYVARLVVSDQGANPPGAALTSERESVPFEIDNTPPTIERDPKASDDARTLSLIVRDGHSPIQRVEYSVDALTWREAFPADGIADGPAERYTIRFDTPGPTRVIVRASDTMANIATSEFRLGS
ncbi:MAG: hypothetical protein GEU99_04815 [Luteitalea sp.]|nr:hypothetical protein [Luteitalea sp.]